MAGGSWMIVGTSPLASFAVTFETRTQAGIDTPVRVGDWRRLRSAGVIHA